MRVYLGLAVIALAVAGSASARASSVGVESLSKPAFTGQMVTIHAQVRPAGTQCSLTIRYSSGKVQRLGTRSATARGVTWGVRIPAVPNGRAQATLACGKAGHGSMSFSVQNALQAPRIVIERSGYSQRPNSRNTASDTCFGLQIRNGRARLDAVRIALLVNLVDADNRVLATDHLRLGRIPAGTTAYTGDQVRMSTTPVARIEVVVVEATSQQMEPATPPLISDVVIAQDSSGPFVGAIFGQLLNQSQLQMQSGEIGFLLQDATGNILGGGRGSARGPVSLGARELFKSSGSFDAVPFGGTAPLVSIVPRYPRQLN
jgi:hypothetical protein